MARLIAAIVAGIALGSSLGGCSDIYFDRRETIGPGAGDALAANEISQMVDPWPAQSGNRNIGYNGQKMQAAVERYRNGKVTPPANPTTSDVLQAQQDAAALVAQSNTQSQTTAAGSGPSPISTTSSTNTTVVSAPNQ